MLPDYHALSAEQISHQLAQAQLGIYRAEWDLEADMHADKQAAVRQMVKHQLAFHQLCSAPQLAQLGSSGVGANAARARELRRLHAHAHGVPLSAIETTAAAALRGLQAWHAARAENNFAILAEPFKNLIALQKSIARTRAENLRAVYGTTLTPYEALIDAYDPGRRLSFIKESFGRVADLCRSILIKHQAQHQALASAPVLPCAVDYQASICRGVITRMGYDADEPRGQLSVSSHPFCRRVAPREVWLTNRYDKQNFLPALLTIIHEGGHGRYYQGLPLALADDWLGGVAGETLNEGMALLAEQCVGRSYEFCQWLAPRINFTMGSHLDAKQLHSMVTHVGQDRLRTDAGEVIYPLHLLLRLEVEEALINDDLPVAELPAFWRVTSERLLGFAPADDNEGCLQDIHLYVGYIGYFPCYLLGFMVAAQVQAAMLRAMPDLPQDWARGDFDRMNHWLQHQIYDHGRVLTPDALITQATGAPLGPDALIRHLNNRYA